MIDGNEIINIVAFWQTLIRIAVMFELIVTVDTLTVLQYLCKVGHLMKL